MGGVRVHAPLERVDTGSPKTISVGILSRLGELPPSSLWPLSRESLQCVESAARDLLAIVPPEASLDWTGDIQQLTHHDGPGEPDPTVTLAKAIRAATLQTNPSHPRKPRYDLASDLLLTIYPKDQVPFPLDTRDIQRHLNARLNVFPW